MKYLEMIKLALALLPILYSAVDQIEDMFPQGGNGQQKLEMVKNIIQSAMTVSEFGVNGFNTVWPMLASMVGGIVAMKKKVMPEPSAQNVIPNYIL